MFGGLIGDVENFCDVFNVFCFVEGFGYYVCYLVF